MKLCALYTYIIVTIHRWLILLRASHSLYRCVGYLAFNAFNSILILSLYLLNHYVFRSCIQPNTCSLSLINDQYS